MAALRPPKAPTDQLRLESFRMLSRLQLIFEFRAWLEYTRDNVPRRFDSPLVRLWDCMSFGAPLCTLLELLGSPTPRHLLVYAEDFDFDLSIDDRKEFILDFIKRVDTLEGQGRLPFGEVLKVDDFLNGTISGFNRVLRTANRVLVALQESYPGLFVVPHGSQARRVSLVQRLRDAEQTHLSRLADIADAASKLYEQGNLMESSLEGFIVNCSRLIPYHNIVFQSLTEAMLPGHERWDEIFAFTNKVFRTTIIASYQSLCANYIPLISFLNGLKREPVHAQQANRIVNDLSDLLNRISEYDIILQAILEVTLPIDPSSYDTLCSMTFEMHQLSQTIEEAGNELRTMWCTRHLKARLGALRSLNVEALGAAILDDRLMVDPGSGSHYAVFLFETILFCCQERHEVDGCNGKYPIKPWELGPGLAQTCQLNLVHTIPTRSFISLHCIDAAYFEINWIDHSNTEKTLVFYPMVPLQYTQWISKLEAYVSRIFHSSSVPNGVDEDNDGASIHSGVSLVLTGDETMYERRKSSARPWSVIGRKGPRSETSSLMVQNEIGDGGSILSPNLLPTFFKRTNGNDIGLQGHSLSKGHRRHRAKSPLSSAFTIESLDLNRTPTASNGFLVPGAPRSGKENGLPTLLDLTGKIAKEGHYPVAHGGHSDVWKGVWHKSDSDVKVAVKVLRNTTSDPAKKAKLVDRLHHELNIWKQLSHPYVLPLYGTVADFGPYTSMVCPWMQNGSVTKYLEKCGDILSVTGRLRMISEVAEGLAYLHLCSVIHGDLSGSNILLSADLKIQLCDFGLSKILVESEAENRASFTSSLGGSVRWADSHFFVSNEGVEAPVMTYKSDVYSLGSVMLEILSGRTPYHYIPTDAQVVIELHRGNRPRRPVQSFVDDDQWELIQWCWTQPPEDRPDVQDVAERVVELLCDRDDD